MRNNRVTFVSRNRYVDPKLEPSWVLYRAQYPGKRHPKDRFIAEFKTRQKARCFQASLVELYDRFGVSL